MSYYMDKAIKDITHYYYINVKEISHISTNSCKANITYRRFCNPMQMIYFTKDIS